MPATTVTPSLRTRIGTDVPLKALGSPVLMIAFFVTYFAILRHPLSPPTVIPRIAVDHWIPFQPWTLAVYASLWLYVLLPSALMVSRRELRDHTLGAVALAVTGLTIFLLWPTITPPTGIDWAAHPQMLFLKNVDASGNACPSLHVAFAVFAAGWLDRMLRRVHANKPALALNFVWAAAIAYSTLGTHQHVALDVLAGALLGWTFVRINLFLSPEQPAS